MNAWQKTVLCLVATAIMGLGVAGAASYSEYLAGHKVSFDLTSPADVKKIGSIGQTMAGVSLRLYGLRIGEVDPQLGPETIVGVIVCENSGMDISGLSMETAVEGALISAGVLQQNIEITNQLIDGQWGSSGYGYSNTINRYFYVAYYPRDEQTLCYIASIENKDAYDQIMSSIHTS